MLVRANHPENYSNRSHTLVMYAPTIEHIRSASGSLATFDEFALRMRPNVILKEAGTSTDTIDQPVAAEDAWGELSCMSDAAVHAKVVRPCTRCDRVCIDPKTGILDKQDSGAVLKSIIATKRSPASSFLTLGVLVDFSPCLLTETLKLSVTQMSTV